MREGFRSVVRRELAWYGESRWNPALLIWIPALTLGLLLWLFSEGVPVELPVALVDEDRSASARELAMRIDATRGVAIVAQPPGLAKAWSLVRQREVYGVVHIPRHWERDGARGDAPPVVFYNNTQYYLIAGLVGGSVQGAVRSVSAEGSVAREARFGGGFEEAAERVATVSADLRTLYNPALSYEAYLAGMIMPAILHLFAVIAAVSALGREFRGRTVGNWIARAGGSLPVAVAGKLAPVLAAYLLLALGLLATLAGWRGWAVAGSFALWYAGIAMLMLASMAVAVLFVGATGNLRFALSLTGVCIATALAYSGFSFPRAAMDLPGRLWSALLPFTWYLPLQQGQWQSGADVAAWARSMGMLALFVAGPLALGWPLLARNARRPERWGGL
jgi:ABC-2 type transport system permease protein